MNDKVELANLIITYLMKLEYRWLRPYGYPELPDNNEPVRIHICTAGNIHRQLQIRDSMIHSEYFFPENSVFVYEHLCDVMHANNHLFEEGICGNGANGGITRSIKLTLDRGANSNPGEWDAIALNAADNMVKLIHYLEPHLPSEFRRWEF
jgi:hypothetical protein